MTCIDDEGIHAAQAWAVLRQGHLSPYTYVYDHVPGGWILVAAWMALMGGPHAFGGAIDSGRALMLLHVGSLLMLCRITRKLGCGIPTAALAAFLFTIRAAAQAGARSREGASSRSPPRAPSSTAYARWTSSPPNQILVRAWSSAPRRH